MKQSFSRRAGTWVVVLVAAMVLVYAGCVDPTDPGGGKPAAIPDELVGTWVSEVAPTVEVEMLTITADGKGTIGGVASPVYDVSVSGKTVEFKYEGTSIGKFRYSINNGEITITEATGGLINLSGLSLVIRKSGGGITYTISANGSISSTTTAITFTFSADPGALSIGDINLSGSASKGSAALSGSGTTRTLSPITVSATGNAVVSINKTGIESGTKIVLVFKQGDAGPITYAISANGSVSSTTTAITFTFSADPGDLSVSDISLSGSASKGSAALSGSGTARTLSPVTVSATGNATVSISKTGIESESKTVPVFKQGDAGPITYTVSANGSASAATSAITFTFSADPGDLSVSDISLSGSASKGSAALSGSGTSRTLSPITVSATGDATVSISKTGIETESKTVPVFKQGDAGSITYTVSADGSETSTTTAITFTFSADPGALSIDDITLSSNASKGNATLSGSGTARTLSPITVRATGNVTVSIIKTGIEDGPKNVTVFFYKEESNPADLVAKWYYSQEEAEEDYLAIAYEFTSDGKVLPAGSDMMGYTYTATGTTITMKWGSISVGSASYIIEGTKLTLSNTGTGGFTAGAYYKKGIGGGPITCTVSANGSSSVTTTALTFTFSADPGEINKNNITLSGNASTGSATLSGSGTTRTLSPITVSASGYVQVYVFITGVETGQKPVKVYKEGDGSGAFDLIAKWYYSQEDADDEETNEALYEFTPDGKMLSRGADTNEYRYTATDSVIKFRTKGINPSQLSQNTSYTIEGTKITFFNTSVLCPVSPGSNYKSGGGGSGNDDITYTVSANGSASSATTEITFTFSDDPGDLSISDITLSGSASMGDAELSGSGTTRTLSPITVNAAGSATVSISKTGIESRAKTVQVYKEEEPIITGNAGVTITFTQIADAAPSITGPVIHRSSGQTTATITVANSGEYSSIEWFITGTAITKTGNSITLDSSNSAYNRIGEHFLTVEVTKDGKLYNKTVTFTVAQ